jgi:hypothetical protein
MCIHCLPPHPALVLLCFEINEHFETCLTCYSTCLFFILGEDFAVVQQEIIMMKDCKHPNIVAYFGSYLRYIICFPFEKQ